MTLIFAKALLSSRMISEDEFRLHNGRYSLIYFIGKNGSIPAFIEVKHNKLFAGDTLLVMSDGAMGSLDEKDL